MFVLFWSVTKRPASTCSQTFARRNPMLGIMTPGLMQEALEMVRPHIAAILKSHAKRQHLAVVATVTAAISPHHPEKTPAENMFLIAHFGDKEAWESDYMRIALSKAEKSARTGKGSAELAPHYLLDGDTVFSGSVVLDDIVVACSGVEPYYDEMFSMWIAAAMKALAKKRFAELPAGTMFIE